MPGKTRIAISLALLLAILACGQGTVQDTPTLPPIATATSKSIETTLPSSTPILIGTEYIVIENASRVRELAGILAPLGLKLAKPLPENFSWEQMQPSQDASIDFRRLDAFVREFHAAGFSELILALKSSSPWAARDYSKLMPGNNAPKPEHMAAYQDWIKAIVERYDADGVDDMPGLQYPVRYYEIGTEFSSYEPEPVEDYLEMLAHAYTAAHQVFPGVVMTHAAFLTTLAFVDNPGPEDYESAFARIPDKNHNLADMRQVLDRPDIFDVVNVHSLGDPYEIEAMVTWLEYEMAQRSYHKPIIISDTAITPFIAWGPATACDRLPAMMGKVIPPATEADRCRLADYFNKLIVGDEQTLRWTQAFVAEDVVKRVVIAAEQGMLLINTAFTEDLFFLKLPLAQAGAGTSAWAGLVDVERREFRPAYYAIQQLILHLKDYDEIRRISHDEPGVRLYEVTANDRRTWIAWYDSRQLVLPGDPIPSKTVQFNVDTTSIKIENLITQFNQTTPERNVIATQNGILSLTLTSQPVFILSQK